MNSGDQRLNSASCTQEVVKGTIHAVKYQKLVRNSKSGGSLARLLFLCYLCDYGKSIALLRDHCPCSCAQQTCKKFARRRHEEDQY